MNEDIQLTEQQIEEFFESGGEKGIEDINLNNESDAASQETENESKEIEQKEEVQKPQKDIESIERERDNYKKAMEAERIQRKEMSQKLQKLEDMFSKITERLNSNAASELESQSINFDENPLEYIKQRQEELNRKNQEYDEFIRRQQEEAKLRDAFHQLAEKAKVSIQEFSSSTPDYMDAYKHLTSSRLSELSALGYTREEALHIIGEDEVNIARMAFSQERNPGEVVYELAKMRGYTPRGASHTTVPPDKKLEMVDKGSSLSKSLSNAGGKVSGAGLSLDSISSMSEEELDKLLDDENWAKLFGVA